MCIIWEQRIASVSLKKASRAVGIKTHQQMYLVDYIGPQSRTPTFLFLMRRPGLRWTWHMRGIRLERETYYLCGCERSRWVVLWSQHCYRHLGTDKLWLDLQDRLTCYQSLLFDAGKRTGPGFFCKILELEKYQSLLVRVTRILIPKLSMSVRLTVQIFYISHWLWLSPQLFLSFFFFFFLFGESPSWGRWGNLDRLFEPVPCRKEDKLHGWRDRQRR